ncbi:ImmA/IrrE family metallo-endopeptidase [Halobacillus campisalis]|uniref:ImmA/IrrE family metallo-endopeptidase n=1 Tax=Halobacillus campisalis TaxID=435909 RepID=A0ABW2K4I1_9BACI|nr:ImmA/IrrE family metallo-endopeptidase [Halobacillus campisalis]
MNFSQYTITALEDWVSNWYIKHTIESRYARFGRYEEIVINSTKDPLIQREQFFHEFCHALRHVGKQTMMPEAFRELQERDARNFTLYAALPYHMIKEYNLKDPEIIGRLSLDFKVAPELYVERLDQIQRRYISARQEKCHTKITEDHLRYL